MMSIRRNVLILSRNLWRKQLVKNRKPLSTACSACAKQKAYAPVVSHLKLCPTLWTYSAYRLCTSTGKTPNKEPEKEGIDKKNADKDVKSIAELLSETATAPAPSPPSTATTPADKIDTLVKVTPVLKKKPREKTDFTKSYYDNVYITPLRAMEEYLLSSGDLGDLARTKRRSPYPEKEDITVYLRRDVERKTIDKFGSLEAMEKEKQKIIKREKRLRSQHFDYKQALRQYNREHEAKERGEDEQPFMFTPSSGVNMQSTESIFSHGSGKVVLIAISVNTVNAIMKLVAWLYSGSHSMFSEFIHSVADTVNQIILAIGINQSLKMADLEHPYGWFNFRNVASLVSGVGIFCVGAGLSFYHGIMGLMHPETTESLYWATLILAGSFVSEGGTLLAAINQVRATSRAEQLTMFEYVWRGIDPSTNVVLLEDLAAVLGVSIAATCMMITYYTGNPTADAVGSLLIGSLLAGVASFIIYTNTVSLVGRSIPWDKKVEIMKELESDRMIRALHDVKATDMGSSYVRFKAEVDFDGRELTRLYLERQDLERLLLEMNELKRLEDVETFMLTHGEKIVDELGSEVDRIEKNLKKKHPEIRHVDLEQL